MVANEWCRTVAGEWCRTELTNGQNCADECAEQHWRMVQLYWWMVQNCVNEWCRTVLKNGGSCTDEWCGTVADEWCRTVLKNGAEQYLRMVQLYWWMVQLYWWMVQNCADEWCRTILKNGAAVLMNGAPLCFYCWIPVVLELTQRELRSSYGSWPVSELRSLWKNTAHNSDSHILELTLQSMKRWGKLELWITMAV